MSEGRTVAKLFGAMLMAVGVLIAGLGGLCSVGFLVMMVTEPGGSALNGIPVVLIFGGVPIAIGVGVFIGGRALWRGPPPPKVDSNTFE
jgi:hypothetical protein